MQKKRFNKKRGAKIPNQILHNKLNDFYSHASNLLSTLLHAHYQTNSNPKIKYNNAKFLLPFFLTALALLTAYNILSLTKMRPNVVYGHDNQLEQRIHFWRNFVESYPDYFEGWYQLAKLYLISGDKYESYKSLNVAKTINPNSEKIDELEDKLGL